ncbi:acyl carrier protein [Spirillospora sp. CA-255316]
MTRADGVLSEVVQMLVDVVGDDFLLEVEVGPETTLNEDLALESIEFVALAERLRRRYGDRADLASLVAGMDLEQIMRMTVGDLVRHIESRPESPAETAGV